MATIILGAALPAVAGATAGTATFAVLGAIGSLAGAYIDNQTIFKEDKDPQRQTDMQLQTATEGGPARSLIGQECRVRGQIISLSPLYQHNSENAVEVAIAVTNESDIDGIVRIYAEGYEIFNEGGFLQEISDKIEIKNWIVSYQCGGSTCYSFGGSNIFSSILGPDLTKFRVQFDTLKMAGWLDGGNNWGNEPSGKGMNRGTVYLTSREPDGRTQLHAAREEWYLNPLVQVSEVAGRTITIEQTFVPVNATFASAIDILKGIPGQVDPPGGAINTYAANAPEMEGTAWVGIRDFKMTQFGLRVPDFVFIVRESATPVTIGQAIDKIFERAGGWAKFTKRSWRVTDLRDDIVYGYTMMEEGSIHHRLQPLVYAFDLAAQIRNSEINFFHPPDARVWAVPESDWGASVDDANVGLSFNPLTPANLPSKVSVHYTDRLTGWEDASVERHIASPHVVSEDSLEIDLRAITMEMTQAVEIAERLLWRPHREGRKFTGNLPARYWYILENDIVETTFNGRSIQLAIQVAERGQDRSIKLSGHVLNPDPPRSVGF
jgi:hypothetical protein